jgi:1,2-diacylglycerol 3-beta-galactosyltransferase
VTRQDEAPVPLLFLIGDTGGGHRSAAAAVAQALDRAWPGRFAPFICDPLQGPNAPRRLRWLVALYGPAIRLTPWLWGVLWRAWGSPRSLRWLRRTFMAPAYGSVAKVIATYRPAMIVSFHPMTSEPAVRARERTAQLLPIVTVITDLITTHLSWRDAAVDRVIVPSAAIASRCSQDGMPEGHYVEIGLPVSAEFCRPPATPAERAALRRSLGLREQFLVVVTGGAEGSGGIDRHTEAILRHLDDVSVAVICGRNEVLRRRLARLADQADGRLTVHGFVDNMADWFRCADVVVGKAGPGTIAEATCCGAPLLLTSYVPGQEEGNAEYVVQAGAGRYAPRPADLVSAIRTLRDDPQALAAMRAASAGIARPTAAADIADLLTNMASDASYGESATLSGRPHRRSNARSAKRRNRHRRHRQLVSRRLRRGRYRSSGTERAPGGDRTPV